MPALVQHRDDAASLEVALVENMAREDLNPVEAARAVAALVEELGLTREEVGRRVGRSRVAISNLLRLLDLPDEALDAGRARRAQRGPRPRAAAGRGPRRPPPAGPRRRSTAAGRCGCSSSGPARPTTARGPPRRGRAPLHPDQEAAAAEIAEALGAALGSDVRVRPRGTGYKVELAFDSADDALALAARVGSRLRRAGSHARCRRGARSPAVVSPLRASRARGRSLHSLAARAISSVG